MAIYFVDPSAGNDTNDGLDVQGLSLVNATYDHTGGAFERMLTSTGAFSGYTFVTGDTIFLLNAAGFADGLYEIASKEDSNIITLAADSRLTVDSTADVDSSNGAFLTSQKAFDTAVAGDEARFCATATETPAAKVDIDTNAGATTNPIVFNGATANGVVDGSIYTVSGSSLPATTTLFEFNVANSYMIFNNVRLTAATDHNFGVTTAVQAAQMHCSNCRFDNATNDGVENGETTTVVVLSFFGCEFDSNGGDGFGADAATRPTGWFYGCSFHDNGGNGCFGGRAASTNTSYHNWCLFYDNGGNGLEVSAGVHSFQLTNSVFFGNTGDGLDMVAAVDNATILNNIFRSNGGFGINTNTGNQFQFLVMDFNCFDNNTSGDIDINGGTPFGSNNVLADPEFVSETDGSEDFGLQASSPCIGAGFPGVLPSGGTGFMDIGALQKEMASGGGVAQALAY